MQTFTVTGRLTEDAELVQLDKSQVINFSIAENSNSYKDEEGKKVDNPEFFDCQRFFKKDSSAGVLEFLKKGKQVSLKGQIWTQKWEKDGQKRSKQVVIVDDIELLS